MDKLRQANKLEDLGPQFEYVELATIRANYAQVNEDHKEFGQARDNHLKAQSLYESAAEKGDDEGCRKSLLLLAKMHERKAKSLKYRIEFPDRLVEADQIKEDLKEKAKKQSITTTIKNYIIVSLDEFDKVREQVQIKEVMTELELVKVDFNKLVKKVLDPMLAQETSQITVKRQDLVSLRDQLH